MGFYVGLASNQLCMRGTNGTLVPAVEVVLVVSNPFYGFDDEGKVAKGQRLSDLRFTSTPHGLRELAKALVEMADEADNPTETESDEEPGCNT